MAHFALRLSCIILMPGSQGLSPTYEQAHVGLDLLPPGILYFLVGNSFTSIFKIDNSTIFKSILVKQMLHDDIITMRVNLQISTFVKKPSSGRRKQHRGSCRRK